MRSFFLPLRMDLSILNNTSIVGCNKAISRCREVGVFLQLSFSFQETCHPSSAVTLPFVQLWGRWTWRWPAILPPQADNQSGLELPATWSSICKLFCQSGYHCFVLFCRSLEELPKQREQGWRSKEVGFMLKAQSFRPGSNLHPVRRIFFCET